MLFTLSFCAGRELHKNITTLTLYQFNVKKFTPCIVNAFVLE